MPSSGNRTLSGLLIRTRRRPAFSVISATTRVCTSCPPPPPLTQRDDQAEQERQPDRLRREQRRDPAGRLEVDRRVDVEVRAGRSAARCPGSRRIAKPMPITAASAWATPLATWRAAYRPGRSRSSRARRAAALPGAGSRRNRPVVADQLGARDARAVPRHHDPDLDPVGGHHRVGAVRLGLGHRPRRRSAAARGPWSAWTRGRPRCGGRRGRSRRRWARPSQDRRGTHGGDNRPRSIAAVRRRSTAAGG